MSKMIKKANAFEILNHWVLAASCFVLAISGFGFLFQLEQIGSLFGGFNQMKLIHNYAGIVFLASLFLTMFSYLPVSLSYSSEDIGWILTGGGYLSKKAAVPPQDIINTGQKLYYLALLVVGYAISASGLAIWFMAGVKKWVLLSHLIHNISFDLIVIMIPVHIYSGAILNPGALRIMLTGTVPLEWAKEHHGKWVKKMGFE